MLSKSLRCLLVLLCALILPLYAQTSKPAPPGAANETMGTNPRATHHNLHPGHTKAHGTSKARLHEASNRLGALLTDTQGKATLTPAAWKTIAGEAMRLADREYGAAAATGNADAKKNAREARMHVRELHAAAMKGDADGAKSHAGLALPYVTKLIDWSA